jgi:2-oxoglutarate dehydrogenase E1 component
METHHPLEGQIANLAFLEQLYQDYQTNPTAFDDTWRHFFQLFEADRKPSLGTPAVSPSFSSSTRIERLAETYRREGYRVAKVNSLAQGASSELPPFNLTSLGFEEKERNQLFPTLGFLPQAEAPLQAIIEALTTRYCQTIGFEFKGWTDRAMEEWIQEFIESGRFDRAFSPDDKRVILDYLNRAELLEAFLHTKHVGKKRFSLEGGESLIPLMIFLIDRSVEEGVEEIFIGMSHRGRLNVLANLLNKSFEDVLKDFDEDYMPGPFEGMGDIRYHQGYANSAVQTHQGKTIKLTVAPNPSHLESVNPVIEGQTRAKQFLVGDETDRRRIIPLLMHGDAAIAGQGVVYETLQLGKLKGYETGGTLHVVINNQVGFTATPEESRSTFSCTDIARTFGSPVFHVNAEDPESCVRVALLALEIRQRFHCDVFIDFNCYRKYGHNEGDEPAFTQPHDYQVIRKKSSIRTLYRDQLIQEGVIEAKHAEEQEERMRKHLQEAYDKTQKKAQTSRESASRSIVEFKPFEPIETHVDLQLLKTLAERFSMIPDQFSPHPKLKNLITERLRAVQENQSIDWGLAEYLAYASLVWEGYPVRLSGQDSGRGTFSHRHALWVDQKEKRIHSPLTQLREGQGRFEVFNSCLSEVAVLGFEYGYSTVCTEGLTIWEAQFGDFANSAQVIIDQYMASGEQKWGQTSSLTLFLPHGFEGQGPEHSSARLERFLSLCGHDNMQVVNLTTPAQLFHVLRRQVKQKWHKPLVVFTPKGLLRHPACISQLEELTQGQFHPILVDLQQPHLVKRVVFCCGRIYYDLEAKRQQDKRADLAIIRIEQLYPLDEESLKQTLAHYTHLQDCQWVQEEPQNMGAWPFISFYLFPLLPAHVPLSFVGRERSATPATGFYARHKQEHANIIHQVFQT